MGVSLKEETVKEDELKEDDFSVPALPDPHLQRLKGLDTYEIVSEKSKNSPGFLIDRLIRFKSKNIIIGDSGVGKTPLGVSLGISICSGVDWLGHKVINTGPVIYFDGESTASNFATVCETTCRAAGLEKMPDNFIVHGKNFADTERDINLVIQEAVEDYHPKMLIIDPLRIFYPDVEKDSGDVSRLINILDKFNSCDFTVVLIHHMRKPDRKAELPSLREAPDEWIKESAGVMGLINHTDTRIGVENINNFQGIALSGRVRGVGVIPYMELDRIKDEDGEAIGYKVRSKLKKEFQDKYDLMPKTIRYKEIKTFFEGSEWTTQLFINACLSANLFNKDGKFYVKTE